MNYYLTLVLDSVASILTVVLVLALVLFLVGMMVLPTLRKRLGFGLDLRKDMWLAILGIVSIVVSHIFAKAISESETRAKYVELGVSILRSEPKSPEAVCNLSNDERALRKWAVDNVRLYSDVPMGPLTEERLICRGLPVPQALIDEHEAAKKGALDEMEATP